MLKESVDPIGAATPAYSRTCHCWSTFTVKCSYYRHIQECRVVRLLECILNPALEPLVEEA